MSKRQAQGSRSEGWTSSEKWSGSTALELVAIARLRGYHLNNSRESSETRRTNQVPVFDTCAGGAAVVFCRASDQKEKAPRTEHSQEWLCHKRVVAPL